MIQTTAVLEPCLCGWLFDKNLDGLIISYAGLSVVVVRWGGP